MAELTRNRELTSPPGKYLFIQDGTNGKVKTNVGPMVVNITGTDVPIVYEGRDFKRCDTMEEALRRSIVVPEGHYVVLVNPAVQTKDGSDVHPNEGPQSNAPDLNIGHKVVIHGPCMFALWPGQAAEVVRGHHLRSNQYLLCRVYNADEARKNAPKLVPVPAAGLTAGQHGSPGVTGPTAESPPVVSPALTVGRLLIIKGTEASFYIPPTGITVVKTVNHDFVRQALTLEQLEYCVLLGESGNKRFVQGPAVVFPEPTEEFMKGEKGETKFRATELNAIQGLHIKVTATYKDDILGREMREGEEIFITGKECPIYFPREEHAIIKYDGVAKHFAVAVPEGEARYVMDRLNGEIATIRGPKMLLPDPTNSVIVRRSLSESECELWYPGNEDVLEYNNALREVAQRSPTTRSGVVSEGDLSRSMKSKGAVGDALRKGMVGASASSLNMQTSMVSNALTSGLTEEISRTSGYTHPRTVTINSKFEGVPRITVWTGFAVMVVDSAGGRRVVEGPANVLLDYDETLEALTMSTGKPKTTDNLMKTPYLRVKNNKISDIINVEAMDHVEVELKLSYQVSFVGEDKNRWFEVENYVKFLCDHMRSQVKAAAKRVPHDKLYSNPLALVESVVLKDEGGPMLFEENSMQVEGVELLSSKITDSEIAGLVKGSQRDTIKRSITLLNARSQLTAVREQQLINVEVAKAEATAASERRALEKTAIKDKLDLTLQELAATINAATKRHEAQQVEEQLVDLSAESSLARAKLARVQELAFMETEQGLRVQLLAAEAEALAKKFTTVSGSLGEAMIAVSSQHTMATMATAASALKVLGGQDLMDVLGGVFEKTGMQAFLKKAAASVLPANGTSGKQLSSGASPTA